MTPAELTAFLETLVRNQVQLSTMIWGPPGIGKSSIVAQTAAAHGLGFVDLRLSQLAPTDLRGLPVAHEGRARWFIPEFLPTEGRGVLFLDEINLAPPTMQGMAQQLVLDRRVGSYSVPEGWFIWAAGNRQEDSASVFEMPAPVANRFLHVDVAPDLESFKQYGLAHGIHEQILAFLSFRPVFLHRFDADQPAWPSPRSWAMASVLHALGQHIRPAVGPGAAAEFHAYIAVYQNLPDLEAILRGDGAGIGFPEDPSTRYAATVGLAIRADGPVAGLHAFRWLTQQAGPEWVQLLAGDLFERLRARGQMRELRRLIGADDALQGWLAEHARLLEL
jgi:ATPase family associated with various cellular activities (AAA)